MRRHDSSSGDMDDPADNIPAVDSATEETPMEVTATKPKHVKIPPPSLPANGVKSNTVSPQQPVGRQSRPQSANKASGAPVRYFILKSYNRENVERSIDQGVWSTQVRLTFNLFLYSRSPCITCAACIMRIAQTAAVCLATQLSLTGLCGPLAGTFYKVDMRLWTDC